MARTVFVLMLVFVFGIDTGTTPAGAAGDLSSSDDASVASLQEARSLIEAGDPEKAIKILEPMNRADPGNADTLNLLGYAQRKLGRFDEALLHYRAALEVEPLHRGANEYLGELYLQRDQQARAEERLQVLVAACPEGCEERAELAAAIEAYRAGRQ